MNKRIVATTLALIATSLANAQFEELWGEAYNGNAGGQDRAHAVAVDKRGCTYIAGEATRTITGIDYVIVKYGPNGGPRLWERPFAGPSDGKDIPRAIAFDEVNDAVYVTGESQAGAVGQPNNRDFLTVKISGSTGAHLAKALQPHCRRQSAR